MRRAHPAVSWLQMKTFFMLSASRTNLGIVRSADFERLNDMLSGRASRVPGGAPGGRKHCWPRRHCRCCSRRRRGAAATARRAPRHRPPAAAADPSGTGRVDGFFASVQYRQSFELLRESDRDPVIARRDPRAEFLRPSFELAVDRRGADHLAVDEHRHLERLPIPAAALPLSGVARITYSAVAGKRCFTWNGSACSVRSRRSRSPRATDAC